MGALDVQKRSHSRSPLRASIPPARHAPGRPSTPLLCLLLGGPGSGKTLLGGGLQKAFPGLCHVSGGDIARLATSDQARRSPLLNSISRQLSDKRRRKVASRRLVEVVTAVLKDGLRKHGDFVGLIVDGVRGADLESFQQALGAQVACILRIECARETRLLRLAGRGSRAGDERLGLADTTDDAGRVDAYLQRADSEDNALRTFLGSAYPARVRAIDGEQTPEVCLHTADKALREAARIAGSDFITALANAEACRPTQDIDWVAQVLTTASRLDEEMHPDGRPRKLQAAVSRSGAEAAQPVAVFAAQEPRLPEVHSQTKAEVEMTHGETV